jgi:hypothetical protein
MRLSWQVLSTLVPLTGLQYAALTTFGWAMQASSAAQEDGEESAGLGQGLRHCAEGPAAAAVCDGVLPEAAAGVEGPAGGAAARHVLLLLPGLLGVLLPGPASERVAAARMSKMRAVWSLPAAHAVTWMLVRGTASQPARPGGCCRPQLRCKAGACSVAKHGAVPWASPAPPHHHHKAEHMM